MVNRNEIQQNNINKKQNIISDNDVIDSSNKNISIYIKELNDRNRKLEKEIKKLKKENKEQFVYNKALIDQINSIYKTNNKAKEFILHLSNTKIYRLAHIVSRTKKQFLLGNIDEKKKYIKWLFGSKKEKSHIYNPLFFAYDLIQEVIPIYEIKDVFGKEFESLYTKLYDDELKEYVDNQIKWITNEKHSHNRKEDLAFRKLINRSKEKKIIVYPAVVPWEPYQTPQLLLKAFAEKGYLCIFCTYGYSSNEVKKLEKNIYSLSEDLFVRNIGETFVNVLITWAASIPFVCSIKNKKVIYSILDNLDIFTFYGKSYELCNDFLCKNSDIVTYVSSPLKTISKRKDSVYLPNGCTPNHILYELENKKGFIPKDIESVLRKGKKIIGYFGWLDSWFDYDCVKELAEKYNNINIVLIGPYNEAKDYVVEKISELKKYSNIFLLGRKKYNELPHYAKYFDIAIIPFLINESMNCVSPIKFYEYCLYEVPTISSYMAEMEQYESKFIKCYKNRKEFFDYVLLFMNQQLSEIDKEEIKKIGLDNTWESRVKVLDKFLYEEKKSF